MSTESKRIKEPRKAKKPITTKLPKQTPGGPIPEAITTKLPKQTPGGPIPEAIIIKRYDLKQRPARGFSLPELNESGLNAAKARNMGLKVDERRQSKHSENLEKLRDYFGGS